MSLRTSFVEFAPLLMPWQLDEAGAAFLLQRLVALSIDIYTRKNTVELLGNARLSGLKFSDDSVLETGMLVISAGIRPRDELARESGITTGERGGIVVNDQQLTNDPDLYAIGEAVLHREKVYGLVDQGNELAECVDRSEERGEGK